MYASRVLTEIKVLEICSVSYLAEITATTLNFTTNVWGEMRITGQRR